MYRILAAALAATVVTTASASSTFFRLSDHPDGNQSPPPYGLRFDGLFSGMAGANGGVTSFSFDFAAFNSSLRPVLRVDFDTVTGDPTTITISGRVFGGEDAGSSYGYGAGQYDLEMTYTVGVEATGSGYRVVAANPANTGTLTALTGDAAGNVFSINDFDAPSFFFQADGHRLAGDNSTWVGRGWLADHDDNRGLTRDFLFIGEQLSGPPIIPLPAPVALGLAGLGLIAAPRRR